MITLTFDLGDTFARYDQGITAPTGSTYQMKELPGPTLYVATETGVHLRRMASSSQCLSGSRAVCLLAARYRVEVSWRSPQGEWGLGQVVPLTTESAAFWFFSPNNIELLVKVLDGCANNNHVWVFAAGLTNVEVRLSVTDTATGQTRLWSTPAGPPYSPLQETQAFTCN